MASFALPTISGSKLRAPSSIGSVRARRTRARAQSDGSNNGASSSGAVISEDVLARLRAAEEEATKLRQQLAEAQGGKAEVPQDPLDAPKRIDGGDLRRETLFTLETDRRNWLSEADVDFFTGAGATESASVSGTAAPSADEKAVVTRRLLIGVALGGATAAFALVPTDALKPPRAKPLFFYLTPLVRIQGILDQCGPVINDGDWPQLQQLLGSIRGAPNNARENLYDAASLLPEAKKAVAQKLALQEVEYLTDMDYNTFFDALPGSKAVPPALQAKFVQFSSSALKAAQSTLRDFLALMPEDQLTAAQQQASYTGF